MFIIAFFSILVFVILFRFHWERKKLYVFSWMTQGPLGLPIIGNGLEFNCEDDDIYDVMVALFKRYKHPMTIWLGPKLLTVVSKLHHVETILSSSKISHKSYVYDFMKEYGKKGLVQNSGPEWKVHRRLVMPLLNQKLAINSLGAVNKLCSKMFERIKVDQETDISHVLHFLCFDIIGDTLFGANACTLDGKNVEVIDCFYRVYLNVFAQMAKPWLQIKFIFALTRYKTERDKQNIVMRKFAKNLMESSMSRVETEKESYFIDQFLRENKKHSLDTETIIDLILSVYTASEDTLTLISAACCLCFGMYPEYQKIVAKEIQHVFGETPRDVTAEDLPKLKYLEMCIKDVMRLFPIAPFILRKSTEELPLGDCTIPAGCEVLIPIDFLHKDPKEWEKPNDFHPDHFLPAAIRKRNVYSYIPFSMGPRSCAGVQLVMPFLKVIMGNILQRFETEAEGKYPDLRFTSYISLRVRDGYNVKLKKRFWN